MGKINIQTMRWNQCKKKGSLISQVNHRGIHCAPPGHTFIVADLSQIEPRVLNFFVGNWKLLDMCKTTSIYDATAIVDGVWSADKGKLEDGDSKLYSLIKARTLALGFNAGEQKFVDMTAGYGMDPYVVIGTDCAEDELEKYKEYLAWKDKRGRTRANQKWFAEMADDRERNLYVKSWTNVQAWRRKNLPVVKYWAGLQQAFEADIQAADPCFSLALPSGRELYYYEPQYVMFKGEKRLAAYRTLHPSRSAKDLKFTYGGKLTENRVQACARDVFCWHCVEIRRQLGLTIPFTVHDEAIIEAPESEAEAYLVEVRRIMSTPPPWMARLPLGCKAHITKRYCK